jgi:DNA mismatch endonuclease (patch repair protein)
MSCIKGKNTKPELLVINGLRRRKIYFATHAKELPGRADIVFRRIKLAVFIDGDFWHGWRFPLWKHKLSFKWQEKIDATRARDQRNFRKLRRDGWTVLRIWEHHIEESVPEVVDRIELAREELLIG